MKQNYEEVQNTYFFCLYIVIAYNENSNMFVTILQDVKPDPTKFCGPYKPGTSITRRQEGNNPNHRNVFNDKNHDTIGMVAIDTAGRIAAGTSTNGLKFKVPG
jgi:hypothetical protein